MAFPGYDAYRNRWPDTGVTLVRKGDQPERFADWVATGKKVSSKDEYVHKGDLGKTF